MLRKAIAVIALSMLVPVAAEAAMVQALDAPVYVDRGRGFQSIVGATEVMPGHLVRAGDTGRAQIIYDNGCKEVVEPGQTVSVAGGSATDDKTLREPPRCPRAGAWLIGVAVAGGVAAIILLDDDDDDGRPKPVSP
jgi:hypothetical protein